MPTISRNRKKNKTSPGLFDDYIRLRLKDGFGRNIVFEKRLSLTDLELDNLRLVVDDVFRCRKDNLDFDFRLKKAVDKICENVAIKALLIQSGLLPDDFVRDYSVGSVALVFFDNLEAKERNGALGSETVFKRKNAVNRFLEFCQLRRKEDIRDIDRNFCELFLDWALYHRKIEGKLAVVSRNTLSAEKKWLSGMFLHAVREGFLAANPFDGVEFKNLNGREDPRRFIIPFNILDFIEIQLQACFGHDNFDNLSGWYVWYMLVRWLGARSNEPFLMRWRDVDFDALGGRGALWCPAPKTARYGVPRRRCPMFNGYGVVRVDCGLKKALQDEYDKQSPQPTDYVVQGILDLPRGDRSGVNWKNINPSHEFEKIVIQAGFKPWPKLVQNLRVTRENELLRHAPMRPDAIHAIIGHSPATFLKSYKCITDEDFLPPKPETFDSWPYDDELKLYYSHDYSPKFSVNGLRLAKKLARNMQGK